MPAATFYQPVEKILNGNCVYEYYNQITETYSISSKSRICHVILNGESGKNSNVVLMIFTIRNQPSAVKNPVWKIHSEGPKRMDPGAVVPLRNTAVRLAKENGWKYIAIAVAHEGVPDTDIISKYVVSMESYSYGNDTAFDLSNALETLQQQGEPDFYRDYVNVNGTVYSFSFIKKNKFIEYLKIFDNRPYSDYTITTGVPVQFKTGVKTQFSCNRIVFGAPGTGKSFMLNNDRIILLGEDNTVDYERVTFHPDYSYANFVGTYKPVPTIDNEGNDAITYEYVPGPFMRVYVNALKNGRTEDARPFLLIIEEINRANVAAVFGDVFQLLDRDENNVSVYPIQASEDMKKYLAKELGGVPDDFCTIKLPDNMYIWATMNSADQGVFPIDTAFKRRWDFTYIGIDDNDADIRGKTVVLGKTMRQKVEWNKLRKAINAFLAKQKINEDKQLGPYFIARSIVVPKNGTEIESTAFKETFKNKVLMYLFEDAAKQKRTTLFEGCLDGKGRYSEICREFDEKGINIFCHDILLDTEHEILPTDEGIIDKNGDE